MQGLDSDAAIVYLGTFSKVLMPAVRISYMVLPPTLAESYRAVRENYNQTASKTEQLALAQYIREGQLERQLRKMRKIYGTKGELLVNCLKAHLPNARFFLQETALRVLIRPDLGLDSAALVRAAAERGVYVRAYGNPADGVISIGFSGIPQEKIAPGIETLCDAWKKACEMRENLVK
jgi:GntR family transcriptional regulator/MocR family aminotransferase